MSSSISKLDKNFEIPNVEMALDWYDLASLKNEGQAWPSDDAGRYGRLPAWAKAVVREPVWELSRHSAGVAMRFVTDSPIVAASWDILNANALAAHMPLSGTNGLDLYVWKENHWRWCGSGIPDIAGETVSFTRKLIVDLPPAKRMFMLYLPLYNGVSAVRLGVQLGSLFEEAPERPAGKDKPMCFYGTSILQGGCASRPGMAYPSIIGRYLDRPQINLGFSGNGKMESEMADLLAEIDPCLYVLDPLPNNDLQGVLDRGEAFILKIRKARAATPVVMVENILSQRVHVMRPAGKALYFDKNNAWRAIFDKLISQGDENLYYIPCDDLYGHDDEATVDGSHATDLGFYRMAQAITPALKKILQTNA